LSDISQEFERYTIPRFTGVRLRRDIRRLKASFRDRLTRFDDLLLSDVPLTRQALRKLIPGRIEFRPVERDGARGYHLRWSLATKALLDGNIGVARGFASYITRLSVPIEAWLDAA
jgi:hypothetical protein